jgi:hypothetical protein
LEAWPLFTATRPATAAPPWTFAPHRGQMATAGGLSPRPTSLPQREQDHTVIQTVRCCGTPGGWGRLQGGEGHPRSWWRRYTGVGETRHTGPGWARHTGIRPRSATLSVSGVEDEEGCWQSKGQDEPDPPGNRAIHECCFRCGIPGSFHLFRARVVGCLRPLGGEGARALRGGKVWRNSGPGWAGVNAGRAEGPELSSRFPQPCYSLLASLTSGS